MKFAIFGLGKSGVASAEYLLARGEAICVWDDGEAARKNFSNPSSITHPDSWNWAEIDALILAPGIPLTHPKPHYIVEAARAHNTPIICDVEILWRDNSDAKFVGITGTNGKSTTTALLAHVLAENGLDVAVGGNLGQAALSLGEHDCYVIEMSSYQLDLIDQARFNISIWLNTTPDHLDRHGDMEGYIAAKSRIFANGNDLKIIGVDDETGQEQFKQASGEKQQISGLDTHGEFCNLPGQHNMQNISAVIAAAKSLGLELEKINAAILTFPGLEHRLEFVLEKDGVKFINDSKATNAESAACALLAFDNIHWLAGGVAKAGGIEALTPHFPRIRKAYLFGKDAPEFAKTLEGKAEFEIFDTLEAATEAATQATNHEQQATVLLSPACASFDQYKSFEARGDHFKKIVRELTQ